MGNRHLMFRAARKILRRTPYTSSYQQINGQSANDYIYNLVSECLSTHKGLMISKFGTIELDNYVCHLINNNGVKFRNYIDALKGEYSIHSDDAFQKLCNNAGFFPNDNSLISRYCQMVKNDIPEIDVLGSYIIAEKYINDLLKQDCVKVDLDGYYAPFKWRNPWTSALKGKNVVVIHPFAKSIKEQYKKRDKLFEDPNTLPEFNNLFVIKAVQSIAGNTNMLPYNNWFEALEDMKKQLDSCVYDAVIVGCGAYGMHLCAHAKRQNKVAIQLAGWTQMLFGIYGKRWIEDQPEYSKYINENWIRPSLDETPNSISSVEGGCYW